MNTTSLVLHLIGGIGFGSLYVTSLWWSSELSGQTGRLSTVFAAMALRLVVLGGVLTAVSFEGAMPLLATALGMLSARAAVLRWFRVAAP